MKIAQWFQQLSSQKIPTQEGAPVAQETKTREGAEETLKGLGLAPTSENKEALALIQAEGIEPTEEAIDAVKVLLEEEVPTATIKKVLHTAASKEIEPTAENLLRLAMVLKEPVDYAGLFERLGLLSGKSQATLPINSENLGDLIKALTIEVHLEGLLPKEKENPVMSVSLEDKNPLVERPLGKTLLIDSLEEEIEKRTIEGEKHNEEKTHRPLLLEEDQEERPSSPERTTDLLETVSAQIEALVKEIEKSDHPLPQDLTRKDLQMLLVHEVTERSRAMEDLFTQEKAQLLGLLERANVTAPKAHLTEAIERLDDLMMKSDLMLYTTMQEEKELATWRQQLTKAKDWVAAGQLEKAKPLVKEVAKALEKIELRFEKVHIELRPKLSAESQMTGRQGLEQLRRLGMNREMEWAKHVLEGEKAPEKTMKEVLLTLKETFGEDAPTLRRVVEGQQLQQKPSTTATDPLMFQIPITVAEKIKPMQVMINSKKEEGPMDAKNCELYFVVDLDRYGQTGIRLQVREGHVTTTVKNDDLAFREDAKKALEPYGSFLKEMGYEMDNVHFTSMDRKEARPTRELPKDRLDVKL